MRDAVTTALSDWESFYVIVGSSGAALTGLQFVVIALVAESTFRSTSREIEAFGTPTIVHFCTVLLLSAILSAPWHALSSAALALGAVAIAGIAYGIIVIRRARRQTGYAPVLEDWLWHATLPLLSHLTLLASAIALGFGREGSLFVIAGVCVVLLFVGIHNAWDTVVYVAIERPPKEKGES
jgi:hypothetical protein